MRLLYNESGFTLFEILVAVAVLAVGTVGTTALTLTVVRGNAISNNITTATTLAQDKLEAIKRSGGFTAAVAGTENYGTIANYSPFKRVTTVVGNPALAPVTRTVTVTVLWQGDKHSVALNTVFAQ
jgi:prepilin-type N-terminal cleavage/methylation domain-containing protein